MAVLLVIVFLIAAFAAVLCIRAAAVKPRRAVTPDDAPAEVDGAGAAERLAQLVRIPTVSDYDESRVDFARFEEFRAKLREFYPAVHAACEPCLCGKTGLLYHWKGKTADEPAVLMAHYDVVPVEADRWEHPPFCGEVFDGELWGRGTLDTKITLAGILEAAEALIASGHVPERDVYFAFAGDEEVNGHGAKDIIAELKRRGVRPGMVLDEGGAVVEGVFPGVKEPIAVVGIGEKGMMNVRLCAKSAGGHASHPERPSALGMACRAAARCEDHPFPAHLTKPAREMLLTLAPHVPFGLRVVLANLWCFGPVLRAAAEKLGSELNAMLRTTMAFTTARGSKQINVLPAEATVGINLRLLNTETPDEAAAYLRRVIRDDRVSVEVDHAEPASPYASTDTAHWDKLASAIAGTWKGCLVSPYLMIACSDSRHYAGYCEDVYKFSAMHLSTEQRGLIHNHNERIPVTEIAKTVEFFTRLERML